MYLPQYTVTTNLRAVVVTATNKFRAAAKVELAAGETVVSVVKTNQ